MPSSEESILKAHPLQDEKEKLLSNNCIFLEEWFMWISTFHSQFLSSYHLNFRSQAEKNWEHMAFLAVYKLMIHTGHFQDKSLDRFYDCCMGTQLVAASFIVAIWSPFCAAPCNPSTAGIILCIWSRVLHDHLCLKLLFPIRLHSVLSGQNMEYLDSWSANIKEQRENKKEQREPSLASQHAGTNTWKFLMEFKVKRLNLW